MPRRSRRRLRIYWPYCQYYGWHHPYGPYGPPPPPPWWMGEPTPEEEKEDLKGHIEMLKRELKAAEEELQSFDKRVRK